MLGLLMPLLVVALGAGPVQFSGTASVYGEYGVLAGDTLARPELRFNMSPTLSFWKVPFSLDILWSTQERDWRQQLDKYRFSLRPAELWGDTTKPSGLAQAIKSIDVGACNPSWSPYILDGAPVRGGAVELNPGFLYLAGAAGRNLRAVLVSDSTDGAYTRMLYSGKFGFGRKERSHFYLTALVARDDPASETFNFRVDTIPPDTSFPETTFEKVEVVKPQENLVLGAEFNLVLAGGAFTVQSEITGSELTRDNRLPVPESFSSIGLDPAFDKYLGWSIPILRPRMSSGLDFAWKVRPTANLLDTRVYGKFEFVGPAYQSLGAPGLRNDNMVTGVGIERDLFNRSVTASFAYTREHDNLLAVEDTHTHRIIRFKKRTTTFTNWDASLGFAFPNLPYLQLAYNPYFESDGGAAASAANVASANAGYSFQTGKLSHSPGFSFSYNDLHGSESDSITTTTDNMNWDAGLNYGLGFEFPLSLSATCGYRKSQVAKDTPPDNRLYFDVSPSYTLFEKWTHSLSLGGKFGTDRRIDARYTTSFPVWKLCDASVSVIGAKYYGKGDEGNYDDLRLTAQLSKSW
jgi:hypothetical protein